MAELYLSVSNGIVPSLPVKEGHGPFALRRTALESVFIQVTISAAGDRIESRCDLDVEQRLLDRLDREQIRLDALSDPARTKEQAALHSDCAELFRPLSETNRFVLRMIEQDLNLIDDAHKLTSGGRQWSLDGKSWMNIPSFIFAVGAYGRMLPKLTEDRIADLQSAIDAGVRPLIALEFLFEAWRQKEQRTTWILATTAAELAIKEVLSSLNPSLEILLLEVPSPPIHKLYATVLDDVTGRKNSIEKSIRSGLQKGVEVRNKIVHRPDSVRLHPNDVVAYLQTVGAAINTLTEIDRSRRGLK